MYNYPDTIRSSCWEQREASRENSGGGYMTAPEQDEHMMALYDAAVQLDGMAQLVALQNRLDAENTMLVVFIVKDETRKERLKEYIRDGIKAQPKMFLVITPDELEKLLRQDIDAKELM